MDHLWRIPHGEYSGHVTVPMTSRDGRRYTSGYILTVSVLLSNLINFIH